MSAVGTLKIFQTKNITLVILTDIGPPLGLNPIQSVCGGTRIFWGGPRGGPIFFSVGKRGDQNFLRVKEEGDQNFFSAFTLFILHYSKKFCAFRATFPFTLPLKPVHI